MSVESISASGDLPCYAELEEEPSIIEELAQKTQSIWCQIYDVVFCDYLYIVHIVRNAISAVARNAFFFPLKWSVIANMKSVRDQLQIEETYARDFWDVTKPVDPNLKDHARIKEVFDHPEDKVFPIQLKDGGTCEITCRIIETKRRGEFYYNFVHVPGIYTTIYNNIGGIHPYLAAYLNAEHEGEPLPPARFIIVSENNLNIKPETLDEASLILLETLKALQVEFGNIDQVVAHSLGTVFLANALKQADSPNLLPKHICFDRGPTSIWEASKKYRLGYLLYLLVSKSRWASDVEQDIVDFCGKWKERPSILVTGVIQDHHFSGGANLCLGEKINKINDVQVLVFDPPRQLVQENAHHNLRADFFNSRYLVWESNYLKSSENLPEAIVRHSLLSAPKVQQKTA
ncbi:MAG TPA: hypothetical protein VLG44_04230 [Chlamydiales bacterium]|nr:hypothetical protein [Chlamydiales bacterium]